MLYIRNRDRVSGDSDAGAFAAIVIRFLLLFRRGNIRNENIAPAGECTGNDILNIQHAIGELLLENLRLHFGGQLGRHQLIQDSICCPRGPRSKPERGCRSHQHADHCERKDRSDHFAAGNTGGSHGGDLSVARHTAESDQDSHQHSQRQGEGQRERDSQTEQVGDSRRGRGAAHQDLE